MNVETIVTESGGKVRVTAKLKGELDHHCAGSVRSKLDSEIAKSDCDELLLDLKEVPIMDSSGLGVILGRYKKLSARGGGIIIKNANRTVDKVLKMSGIYSLVKKN